MVKFDVKPHLTVRNNSDVSASVKVSHSRWGNEFSVTLSDEMVKDGLSANGMRLGLKAKSMELEYAVAHNQPKFTFHSGLTVKDKDIKLKYVANVNKGSSIEASVPVDDDNKCVVTYDLTSYDGPDYKKASIKWCHTRDDLLLEPSFNLGSESLTVAATYKVDSENKLKVTYDTKSQNGTLEWTNTRDMLGSDGALKITAKQRVDADNLKSMPTLMIEKTWGLDI